MKTEINGKSVLVSDKGGSLDVVDASGEIVASIAVPAGRVRASQYLDLLPEGCCFQVASGLAVMQPRHRIGIQPYGAGSHSSGANPDYQPTSASRFEREMRLQLSRLKASNDAVERRLRAFDVVERIPQAPVEVIEPTPAPAVENPPVVE